MTEPTPPPDEPIPDQTRARIREELMAATRAPSAGPGRWGVLAGVAASIVLVAGVTAWAVGLGDESSAPELEGPATSTSGTSSATPSATSSVDPAPSETATSSPPSDDASTTTESPSVECEPELKFVLKGAELALEVPGGDGNTSFWVRDQQFALCDIRAGMVTVHKPLPLEPDLDDPATFRVSTVFRPTEAGFETIRVAGGVVPEGAPAFDVEYTFPDGHTEKATTATDEQGRTWWRMVYAYDAGGGNEMQKPPIEVAVTLSGSAFGFTLDWATDTCAQANHGC